MIRVDNIRVYNIARAIYSARNPLNSWALSDSGLETDILGDNDLKLAKNLYKAGGTSHRKYLRQIFVTMDITAPLFWWKQFDQYKIGITTNSCSTMHKIASEPITIDNFSFSNPNGAFEKTIVKACEDLRQWYVETKDIDTWRMLIEALPCAYNQMRTATMSYENIMNMIDQREHHKLSEWQDLCKIFRELPYINEIRGDNNVSIADND